MLEYFLPVSLAALRNRLLVLDVQLVLALELELLLVLEYNWRG
jgi:hypothetical protein